MTLGLCVNVSVVPDGPPTTVVRAPEGCKVITRLELDGGTTTTLVWPGIVVVRPDGPPVKVTTPPLGDPFGPTNMVIVVPFGKVVAMPEPQTCEGEAALVEAAFGPKNTVIGVPLTLVAIPDPQSGCRDDVDIVDVVVLHSTIVVTCTEQEVQFCAGALACIVAPGAGAVACATVVFCAGAGCGCDVTTDG